MRLQKFYSMAVTMGIALASCTSQGAKEGKNPLLEAYNTPFNAPPFEDIKIEHYKPAYEEALKQHAAEIDSIANNPEPATFDNTIVALDNAGQLLNNVSAIFENLNSAHTNEQIQALAKELAPTLSAHYDQIQLNPTLFARVKHVWDNKAQFHLTEEQDRLLELCYKGFVRSGANLDDAQKEKLKSINAQLSVLTLEYGENLLAETNNFELVVDKKEDLAGLPQELIDAAAATAKEKGKAGKWVFDLSNPSVMPFLQYADNRALRQQIWEAYTKRGDNKGYQNCQLKIRESTIAWIS
jgi:peptidyl-dipeptidase Dcp